MNEISIAYNQISEIFKNTLNKAFCPNAIQ